MDFAQIFAEGKARETWDSRVDQRSCTMKKLKEKIGRENRFTFLIISWIGPKKKKQTNNKQKEESMNRCKR